MGQQFFQMAQPDLFPRQIKDDLEGLPSDSAIPLIWLSIQPHPATWQPPWRNRGAVKRPPQ
jgi:hypothetical protein